MNESAIVISSCKNEISMQQKPRESNLELFRIIVMLLIVAHHYAVNSGLIDLINKTPLAANSIFLLLFGAWGKTGINCFVLITGYFMCKSHITVKKFAKLLFEIEFYNIIIYFIFLLAGYQAFSLTGLVKSVLPIITISTGFTSCYLIFFLCIPFLNILSQHLNEKQHICLLLLCTFTYIILGTLPYFGVTMNYVSWFIVLYFIASYIRIYPKKVYENQKFWGWLLLGFSIVSAFSVIACAWIGTKLDKQMAFYFVSDSNKIFAVVTAICAFMFFKNIRVKYSRFINAVGASTFGVLLIHANSDTMRQWLWKDILNNVGMYNSSLLVVHAIGSVLAIFSICTIIDYLRIRFIEAPFSTYWDKHWGGFLSRFKKAESILCVKLDIKEDS